MSLPLYVNTKRVTRLVPVRFRRADYGDPNEGKPEIDDRGYGTNEHASVVGVKKGNTITVRCKRTKLEEATNLYAVTPDTSIIKIVNPPDGKLPNAEDMDFDIQALDGGNPKTAEVEIRLDSPKGMLLHVFTVWVFTELKVSVTPHLITISDSTGASVAPTADVDSIMVKVREIWSTAGITISVGAKLPDTIPLAKAGVVSDNPYPGELDKILKKFYVPSSINVYFVNQIGSANVLGYGFSRASQKSYKLANPGIFLGDKTASSARSGTIHYANDLAHEIGHFFQLWHCENKQPPNEREDTWSRRKLMHNHNGMLSHDPWPLAFNKTTNYQNRPRFDDAGYGPSRRGCMVTMKKLSQLVTDGDVTTVRTTISSTAGPY